MRAVIKQAIAQADLRPINIQNEIDRLNQDLKELEDRKSLLKSIIRRLNRQLHRTAAPHTNCHTTLGIKYPED
jgi:chromosome segregation ATPase